MSSKKVNTQREINPNSIRPIYIELFYNDIKLASGTASFVKSKKGPIFITNRHNVTGKHQETNKPLNSQCAIPNNIRFRVVGNHKPFWYALDLYTDSDSEESVWVEHPLGTSVDVVGILIPEISNAIHLFVETHDEWHKWRVGDRVHVLGYPFGMSDQFAIWSTGYIASEPDTNFKGLPSFLIDCRARQGQSGSIVIARFMPGDIVESQGNKYQAQKEMVHFLGVYSGRINSESDLGIVWKMSILKELIYTIEANNVTEVKCAYHRLQNHEC
jgi:hypothetical protein